MGFHFWVIIIPYPSADSISNPYSGNVLLQFMIHELALGETVHESLQAASAASFSFMNQDILIIAGPFSQPVTLSELLPVLRERRELVAAIIACDALSLERKSVRDDIYTIVASHVDPLVIVSPPSLEYISVKPVKRPNNTMKPPQYLDNKWLWRRGR